jgi:prevent-host-death family protein
MRSVSIEEFHEHTDELVAEVETGRRLTVIRAGKPVAEVVPCAKVATFEERRLDPKREAARRRLLAIMDEGLDLGGEPFTYEERHER